MRIIVAEDNEEGRRFIVQAFQNAPDRQFVLTANGAEAWWHLSNPAERFDLGVFDVDMPVVGGMELLARVRAEPRLGGLRVLLATAAIDRATVMDAVGLKVSGYLAKPFGAAALQRAVLDIEASILEAAVRRSAP